jgi:hypothetical protein
MERDELADRRFSQEEIGELIETAARLDQLRHEGQGLSVEELRQIATELGISDEALLAAVHHRMEAERASAEEAANEQRRREKEAKAERKRREARRSQLNDWKAHLASYAGVMAGLSAIDFFPDRSLDWVVFPAAGWGIGLAIHTFNVLFGVEEE